VCDLVELPFRITFSAKPKIERLRTTHHLKAAERYWLVEQVNGNTIKESTKK
jgi:hypothetical protein